jgi:2-C-methyl-D-erythritol 4-phosphate cytidylyltransferase/2-C-methyl-D-erythritol 2,4-cyclodiphosphate synthase
VEEIVLVLPSGQEPAMPSGLSPSIPLKLAPGGPTRTDSVRNGLRECTRDYVMVHDAARPFVSQSLLRALAERTTPTQGAIPVLPVTEALKSVTETQVRAVEREGLYVTQTPQSFFRKALAETLEGTAASRNSFKDEAEAWLAAGRELCCVPGERLNFKVTWPEDLDIADALAKGKLSRGFAPNPTQGPWAPENPIYFETRTGIGYDVHRLTPERPLILGGVRVPSSLGLLGHSDADVLAHAVADALLGAAGLPDIGNLFPASEQRYRGADSLELLRRAALLTRQEGWKVVWVDSVVEAQVPRLNEHIPAMKEKLSEALRPDGPLCVGVKAKSAEGTGDPGLARSIVCRAVATLRRE